MILDNFLINCLCNYYLGNKEENEQETLDANGEYVH